MEPTQSDPESPKPAAPASRKHWWIYAAILLVCVGCPVASALKPDHQDADRPAEGTCSYYLGQAPTNRRAWAQTELTQLRTRDGKSAPSSAEVDDFASRVVTGCKEAKTDSLDAVAEAVYITR